MVLDSKYSAVDSCILLRVILRDNREQLERALALLLSGRDLYVDDIVVLEVVYVLTKIKMTRENIVGNLRLLLCNPVFLWNEEFLEPIFVRYLTHPSLSFDDCYLAAKVAKHGYQPLWTFDRKFANQTEAARLVE